MNEGHGGPHSPPAVNEGRLNGLKDELRASDKRKGDGVVEFERAIEHLGKSGMESLGNTQQVELKNDGNG
eukprot:2267617-Pleurochrysis_carterae.AAC.2